MSDNATMSDTIIQVENIGKKYIIHHQTQGNYTALREVIMNKMAGWGNNFLSAFINRQTPDTKYPKKEEFWALKDISFEVKQGEVVGIIGPNGAGKTTLLKILSRITEPTMGRFRLKGHVSSLLEVGTGFHPELTGRENIFLNGAILGMTRQEIKNKFDEIVAFSEIEKFLDTPVKRYSSGMYVRLAFSVAAHLEPEILLVDEVLAVGDAAFQKKCLTKMDDVSKQGKTVLLVSHNMASVKKICTACIYLRSGQMLEIGPSDQIIDLYMLEAMNKNFKKKYSYSIDKNALLNCKTDGFKIKKIEITNPNDNGSNIVSGGDIRIRINYKASRKFIAPAFVFIFKDYRGIEVFRLSNMPISGFTIEELFSKGTIDLIIESIPLVKGIYYVDVGFVRESVEWYFRAENLIRLVIGGKDIYKSGLELDRHRGIIWVRHSWKHINMK